MFVQYIPKYIKRTCSCLIEHLNQISAFCRFPFKNQCSNIFKTTSRLKSSNQEIKSLLRPFFFRCHPDLFGNYPEQRQTNEHSLQTLSAHLEHLQRRSTPQNTQSLLFYIRIKDKDKPFKLVKIPLNTTEIQKFIVNILRIAECDEEDIKKVEQHAKIQSPKRTLSEFHPSRKYSEADDDMSEEFELFQFKLRRAREDESLQKFLKKNIDLASIRTKSLDDLKEEVQKLKNELQAKLKCIEISYLCGWNFEHFRGCLKSLEKLHESYPEISENLRNRKVIFSQFTGLSLDGDVHLFTGDVRNNWLDLIKNISKQEIFLLTIPKYEVTLSQVLLDIKIARRKFMPKTLAKNYSSHLSKLITNILDYLGKNKFPKSWPKSLRDYELVVESESGPLMVSPTGQFITPSTCPGFLIVDFLSKNLDEARTRQENYKKNKYIERDLHKACMKKLNTFTVLKSDEITPDLMITCLQNLLKTDLKLNNLNLYITSYYSILNDGTICIPYNFKL